MKSLKKIADLADIFEFKLKYAQAPSVSGDDPKAVTADAFFGPYKEQEFQKYILAQGSKFLSAIPEGVSCNIGAAVDSSAGKAEFLVSTTPPNKNVAAIKAALLEDFKSAFGAYPPARLAARMKSGEVKPGVKISHPSIITVT